MEIRIHLISDLYLGINEFNDPVEFDIPDVDLVILNGNLGHPKRSFFYAQELCKKYPQIQFIYNLGLMENYFFAVSKNETEIIDSIVIRIKNNSTTPKNLSFSTEPQILNIKGKEIDLLTTFGFCKIVKQNVPWENTYWFKKIIAKTIFITDGIDDLPTHKCGHGYYPIWASMDWVNEQYEKECKKVKNWELIEGRYKILCTNINPYNDKVNEGLVISPYLVHLNKGLWLSGGEKIEINNFLGSKLISNPGRGISARRQIITIDI